MSSIIKAGDRNRGIQSVAFNLEDMREHADSYLSGIRQQAKKIIADAAEEAKKIRQRAEVEGRQAGERALEEMLNRKLAEQLKTALPALAQAIKQIEDSRPGWLAHWEQRAVHLAVAIAGRLVRRQIQVDPAITVQTVRDALELARGSSHMRVLLNPADHAALGSQIERLTAEFSRLGTAEIVPDERISAGGCRVETQHGAVDQQLEARLARIEAELT